MRTIAHANKIVVLEDGTVIETGSPETLKRENSTFAHMLALQANNEK